MNSPNFESRSYILDFEFLGVLVGLRSTTSGHRFLPLDIIISDRYSIHHGVFDECKAVLFRKLVGDDFPDLLFILHVGPLHFGCERIPHPVLHSDSLFYQVLVVLPDAVDPRLYVVELVLNANFGHEHLRSHLVGLRPLPHYLHQAPPVCAYVQL